MTAPINPDAGGYPDDHSDTLLSISLTFAFFSLAVKSQIRESLINNKVNACPMAMRVAWHSSGTYDANKGTGGSGEWLHMVIITLDMR